MADRISQYRCVRVCIFPPRVDGDRASYTVVADTIRKGIPHAKLLWRGAIPNAPALPSIGEVQALLDSVLTDLEAR